MKALCLDIGAGTEDILLYEDDAKTIENCIKLVLPSPTRVFAAKVKEATHKHRDLFIKGDVIGGGALSFALKNHVEKGNRVVMTENAAYTVRNDLDEVRNLGIEISRGESEPQNFQGDSLTLEEVNLRQLQSFLELFNEPLSDVDVVAIAVQDHGIFPKGMSNRKTRIQYMKHRLETNPKPEALAFTEQEIPSPFLRMRSASSASRRQLSLANVLLMDTSPDAILGSLTDPVAEQAKTVLAINVGNGHTMAAIVSQEKIVGVMEHHTYLLNPHKLERMLIDFADGRLSDAEVFNDHGHGLFFLEKPPGFSGVDKVVATGPNRQILNQTNLSVHFAAPAGDVMMTGPVGLIEAVKRKFY